MRFDLNGISVPVSVYNNYINKLQDQIYKVLPIYEDCDKIKNKDFSSWNTYLDTLITQLMGSEVLFSDNTFMKLTTTLIGLNERTDLTQKQVKSVVFGCLDTLGKLKRQEG